MEGQQLHAQFTTSANSELFNMLNSSTNVLSTNSNELDNRTSLTPPYFKTEPLDDSAGQLGLANDLPGQIVLANQQQPAVHSVERILFQEYKPTISPALLSAVEQVTLETSKHHQPQDHPQSLPLQPLPQLNTLVHSIGRSPPDCGASGGGILMSGMPANIYVNSDQSIISPGRVSAAPSTGSASSIIGANEELYGSRPISPLRGRGRPPLNNSSDGCQRQHTCPECGKRFPNNSALAKHRLIHSDERKFICEVCQKAFKRQDHLNGHLNVHKSVKPFPCILNGCDRSYCDARSLRRHLEHSHNVQNPIVHSSRGTVYIKCEDYEATIPTNRMDLGVGNDSGESGGHNSNEDLSQGKSPIDIDMVNLDQSSVVMDHHHNTISPDMMIGDSQMGAKQHFLCPPCGRTFRTSVDYSDHMLLHSRGASPSSNNETTMSNEEQAVFYSHVSSATATPVSRSPVAQLGTSGYSNFQPIRQQPAMTDLISFDQQQQQQPVSMVGHHQADSYPQQHQHHIHQPHQHHHHQPLHQCYSDSSMQDYMNVHQHQHQGALHQSGIALHPNVVQQQHSYGGMLNDDNDNLHMSPHHHALHANVISRGGGGGVHHNARTVAQTVSVDNSDVASCHQTLSPIQQAVANNQQQQRAPAVATTVSQQHPPPGILAQPLSAKNLAQTLSVIVPPVTSSPYCPLPSDDHDSLFPQLDMPAGSAAFGGYSIDNNINDVETPLDLGPLLKDVVDDESIRRELEMYDPGGRASQNNPFEFGNMLNDDDDFLSGNKYFERKRHLTAPSALSTSFLQQQHQQRPPTVDASSSALSAFGAPIITSGSKQQPTPKSSRPPSRLRRKSRGKPDNVFMLLGQQNWRRSPASSSTMTSSSASKRSFQLPVSPVRFRKHLSGNGNYPGASTAAGGRQQRFHSSTSKGANYNGRHRPAPLIIPTAYTATLNRFHSQLRSPRLWVEAPPLAARTPYTPPPMLSPVRKGSGLFWRINLAFTSICSGNNSNNGGGGPKSAPISPKFCREFFARGILNQQQPTTDFAIFDSDCATDAEAVAAPADCKPKSSVQSSPPDSDVTVSPPETDTTPHINVGEEYQANVPDLLETCDRSICEHKADIMFDPICVDDRDDDEIDAYVDFASSCAVVGGGQNKEYALHLLYNTGGNVEQSVLLLMNPRCSLASDHPLYGYEFVDSTAWSVESIRRFQESLVRNDKDFFVISSEVKSKTVKQCVAFYYTWKKVCNDEYRRLKFVRRRRELPEALQHPNTYNLRSGFDGQAPPDGAPSRQPPIQALNFDTPLPAPPQSPYHHRRRLEMTYQHHNQQQHQQHAEGHLPDTIDSIIANSNDSATNVASSVIECKQQLQHQQPVCSSDMQKELENILNIIASKSKERPAESKEQPTHALQPFVVVTKTKKQTNREGVFPCRICEKVFYKIKSRNAHMKSHSTKG